MHTLHILMGGALLTALVGCASSDAGSGPGGTTGGSAGGGTGGTGGTTTGGTGPGGTTGGGTGGTTTGGTGPGGTTGGGTGGTTTGGTGGGGAGGTGAGGSGGGEPEMTQSNTPGTFNFSYQGDTDKIFFSSSNFKQDVSGSEYFQEWYGETRNDSAAPLCLVEVVIDFRNASGTSLASFKAYSAAEAHQTSGTLSTACMPPGGYGAYYSNGFAPSMVNVSEIATIDVTFGGLARPQAVPHPLAPVITSGMLVERFGTGSNLWAVEGIVTNNAGTIYNVAMDVFPKIGGLVVDRLGDHHLDTFLQGTTWNYQTTTTEGTYTEYHQYLSFIEGAAKIIPPTPGSEAHEEWQLREAQSASRDATRRRLEQHRANRE